MVPFFGKYKGVANYCLLRSLTALVYKYSGLSHFATCKSAIDPGCWSGSPLSPWHSQWKN